MKNYWLNLGNTVIEREALIYDRRSDAATIFRDMPPKFPIVVWADDQARFKEVGIVHSLKLMVKLGIEGVMKCPRKYHRNRYELSQNRKKIQPVFLKAKEPYWLVIFEDF